MESKLAQVEEVTKCGLTCVQREAKTKCKEVREEW